MFLCCTLLLVLCLCFVNCCHDEFNQKVDWYVLYKLPIEKTHNNPLIQNGVAYAYITSRDNSLKWKLSYISINAENSIPGNTFSRLYSHHFSTYILYNDEPHSDSEVKTNSELGHTKGLLAIDGNSGFWLVHSVPKYPPKYNYSYPKTAIEYGQSFLCISLDMHNLNLAGKQLQYNQPNIYKSNIDPKLKNFIPDIQKVIDKKFISKSPWNNLQELTTMGGKKFLSFAKTRDFGKDLYSDWVAIELKNNLYVESWLHGPGRLPSECYTKLFTVKNIEMINIRAVKYSFNSERDHSKWAVSTDHKTPWICVGDINRAEHQKKRGGGTLCTDNFIELWADYYTSINKTEPCK